MKKKVWMDQTLIILALILAMLAAGALKQGFHIDEVHSFSLSNNYEAPFARHFGSWISSAYYQEALTVQEGQRFAFGSVYYNQSQDVHPPLYYLIVNSVMSLVPNHFSKWFLIGINSVIALGIYFLSQKIFSRLLPHLTPRQNVYLPLVWFLSQGACGMLLFGRMYYLSALWALAVFWQGLKLVHYLVDGQEVRYRSWLALAGWAYLGMLTHYHFLVYLAFFYLGFGIFLLINRYFRSVLLLIASFLIGVGGSTLTFPYIWRHVFDSSRGAQSLERLGLWDIDRFLSYSKLLLTLSWNEQVFLLLLVIGFFFLWARLDKSPMKGRPLTFYWLLGVPVLFMIFIQMTAPYVAGRYLYLALPLFVIGTICWFLRYAPRTWYSLLIAILLVIQGLFLYDEGISTYTYTDHQPIYQSLQKEGQHDAIVLNQQDFKITEILPFLSKMRNVLPLSRVEEEQVRLGMVSPEPLTEEVWLFIDQDLKEEEWLDRLLKQTNYRNSERIGSTTYYSIYCLKRK